MIPKIIHYVWVGGKPKPAYIKTCINSWRKHLRGYRVIEWNETTINLKETRYLEEAYSEKKWAFVSDYVRLKAVYEYGGIYLDSDCYVLKTLDSFLGHTFFTGFERDDYPFTAVFGATPKNEVIGRLLAEYKKKSFLLPDGTLDMTTNTVLISKILFEEFGCTSGGKYQDIGEGRVIYPADVLCRYSRKSKVVHLMGGSWEDNHASHRRLIKMLGGRGSATLFRIRHGILYGLLEFLADAWSRKTTRT